MNIMEAAVLAKEGKTLYSKSYNMYLHLDENKRLVFGAYKFSHYVYTDNIDLDALLATDWEVVK